MSAHQALRRVRKALSQDGTNYRRTPVDLGRAAVATMQMSRFFYVLVVFAIVTRRIGKGYSGPPTHALWPIDMLEGLTGTGWLANTTAVWASGLGMALLAAMVPRSLILRLGIFIYLLLYIAISNSYGSINHGQTRLHLCELRSPVLAWRQDAYGMVAQECAFVSGDLMANSEYVAASLYAIRILEDMAKQP